MKASLRVVRQPEEISLPLLTYGIPYACTHSFRPGPKVAAMASCYSEIGEWREMRSPRIRIIDYRGGLNYHSQVVRMLQACSGRTDKQLQEQNSPNLGTKLQPTTVHVRQPV